MAHLHHLPLHWLRRHGATHVLRERRVPAHRHHGKAGPLHIPPTPPPPRQGGHRHSCTAQTGVGSCKHMTPPPPPFPVLLQEEGPSQRLRTAPFSERTVPTCHHLLKPEAQLLCSSSLLTPSCLDATAGGRLPSASPAGRPPGRAERPLPCETASCTLLVIFCDSGRGGSKAHPIPPPLPANELSN